MKKKKPAEKKKPPAPKAGQGDHIFFHHQDHGPMGGHVVACGKHGATVKCPKGQHHKVRWESVLGHKQRAERQACVIEEGEDGAICEDQHGRRFFLRHGGPPKKGEGPEAAGDETEEESPGDDEDPDPDDEEEEEGMSKAILFLRTEGPMLKAEGKSGRPGLALQDVTDKKGHHTRRWKRTGQDDGGGQQRGQGGGEEPVTERPEGAEGQDGQRGQELVGQSVKFNAGAFQGEGEVTAAGKDGVTVKDSTGREHQVHWHELQEGASEEQEGAGDPPEPPVGAVPEFFSDDEVKDLPSKPSQPFGSEEEVYTAAEEAHKHFDSWLAGVAKELGVERGKDIENTDWTQSGGLFFVAPLKGKDRAQEKVEGKYGGDWSRLCDVVRGTIAVDSMEDLGALVDKLKDTGMELAAKPEDKFSSPTAVGYRDLSLDVQMPNGTVAELQLNLKSIMEAKDDGHKFYEFMRKLDEKADDSEWSDEEKRRYKEAMQESIKLYTEAWNKVAGKEQKGGDGRLKKSFTSTIMEVLLWRKPK